jgi:hypothetical protein
MKFFVLLLSANMVFAWHSTCSGSKGYNTYDVHGCFSRIDNQPGTGEHKNNIECYMSDVDHKCKDPSEQEFDKAAGDLNYWCDSYYRGVNNPDCNNWKISYVAS